MQTQHGVSAQPGTVAISVSVRAAPATVYAALTEATRTAQWFGDIGRTLQSGGRARLDFGDGDYFSIDEIVLDPPRSVAYRWRFLGIMPANAIRWAIEPAPSGSLVTVTDADPLRGHDEAEMLREGWKDFTTRLQGFLASGQSTRYDWRRAFDGGIELPCGPTEAMALVTRPTLAARWLPTDRGLVAGAQLVLQDGLEPQGVQIAGVVEQPGSVSLAVTSPLWRAPTECTFEARRRGGGVLLSVAHTGWEEIDNRDDVQRVQRRRFAQMWIAALQRARDLFNEAARTLENPFGNSNREEASAAR